MPEKVPRTSAQEVDHPYKCRSGTLAIARDAPRATGVATISWTRGYDGSGCAVGSVGLGRGSVVEVDLVA